MSITFREIERMYRKHSMNMAKLFLAQDAEPKMTQVITDMPIYHSGESTVEKLAINIADPEIEVKKVQRLLGAMTHDEREFIEYRYFQDYDWLRVACKMNVSMATVGRIRLSALSKSKYMLDTPG